MSPFVNPRYYTLQELLNEQVRDLYDAESQFTAMLPDFIENATAADLKEILLEIAEEAAERKSRLAELCLALGVPPSGITCEAMRGLVREGAEATDHWENSAVRDAAIIANAQRVTHYEIAGFGTAREFARCLKDTRSAGILRSLLLQVSDTDRNLTRVATGGWFATGVNHEALPVAS